MKVRQASTECVSWRHRRWNLYGWDDVRMQSNLVYAIINIGFKYSPSTMRVAQSYSAMRSGVSCVDCTPQLLVVLFVWSD